MKGKENRSALIKGFAVSVMAFGLITISYIESSAQTNDFFSNTQVTDQRSDGSNNLPGFNPCPGGTLTTSACTGSTGLLNNISTFITLGPGAVTDNMFGRVAGAALGADGIVGGIGNNADTAVTKCAPGFGTAGSDPNGLNGLNCGDVRINPAQQGQTIPTGGNNLTGALSGNHSQDMNSGSGASLHRSQLENAFVWNPTTSAVTLAVNTSNMPTINSVAPTADVCAAGTTLNPRVCGQQSMQETTGLSGATTVKVDLTTSWSTTNSSTGTMGANPTISWRMHINQADVVGTGGAFDQEIQGSFEYNAAATSFPTVQYPNGESFTNASIASANLP